MRVIVDGRWYDGNKEMIVLVLTEEDKKNISEMGIGQFTYVQLRNKEGLSLIEMYNRKLEEEMNGVLGKEVKDGGLGD